MMKAFTAVARYVSSTEAVSIDEVVDHLRTAEKLEVSSEYPDASRLLVFAILGWQTMLYKPAFNICSFGDLAIYADDLRPDSGLVFDSYRVPVDLADRPLSVLLKGFGHLLPARNGSLSRLASENSAIAASWLPIYPGDTNIHNLHNLLNTSIHWTDTLALHLDFDKSARTLTLFSSPSICLDMLKHHGSIYSFASTDSSTIDPRGTEEDIAQFLQDILLSYRLLFAQSAASRKLFRQSYEPSKELGYQVDSLLPLLCTSKELGLLSEFMPRDRPIYYAARDFPVLFHRMELLVSELRVTKPKSIRDLLHDRRDTLQYWTFWLVSIIGGLGIFLSLVQVILQGVQVRYTLLS